MLPVSIVLHVVLLDVCVDPAGLSEVVSPSISAAHVLDGTLLQPAG